MGRLGAHVRAPKVLSEGGLSPVVALNDCSHLRLQLLVPLHLYVCTRVKSLSIRSRKGRVGAPGLDSSA